MNKGLKARIRRSIRSTQKENGYADIYADLVASLSNEPGWGIFSLGIWLIVWFYLLPFAVERQDPIDYIIGAILIVGSSIVLLFFFGVFFVARSISRNPQGEIPILSVRILTALPRPYTQKIGLGYKEIQRIKKIAEVEQAAADWRSAFVNIVIIGTLTVTVWVSPFIWRLLNEPPTDERAMSPWEKYYTFYLNLDPFWGSLLTISSIAIAILSILWVAATLFRYLRLYLASELANRMILEACEEAEAFLEAFGLTQKEVFSFREKRAIAAHFGCKIVPEREASWMDKLWTWGEESDGLFWYLLPPVKRSRFMAIRYRVQRYKFWVQNYRRSSTVSHNIISMKKPKTKKFLESKLANRLAAMVFRTKHWLNRPRQSSVSPQSTQTIDGDKQT